MQGGFWADFRSFAVKGNVIDLAVAVVVGNAFTGVINSLVGDIMTPLMSLLTPGSGDIKNFSVTIPAPVGPAAVVHYGSFVQTLINFLIITLSIFLVIKIMSATRKRLFRRGEKATPPEQKPAQERLLEEIRDLLKAQGRV